MNLFNAFDEAKRNSLARLGQRHDFAHSCALVPIRSARSAKGIWR